MTSDSQPPNRFDPALDAFLRAVLRLIIVLGIVGAVVGLVTFGTVAYYQQAVRPASENATRMAHLETAQALNQEQQTTQLRQLEARISAIESQRAIDGGNLADLTGNVQSLQVALDQQNQALSQLAQIETDLTSLSYISSYNATQTAGFSVTLQAGDPTVAQLQRDLQLLRASQYLDQARILLAQSNYGEAELSVFHARQALEILLEQVNESQQPLVSGWLQRIDVVRSELPAYPALAAQDLEIAWGSMLQGFSLQPQTVSIFPETITPTPTPTAYLTPTPFYTTSPYGSDPFSSSPTPTQATIRDQS